MHQFPKLINDLIENNKLDLDTLLSCGIPWLKLNIEVPRFSKEVIQEGILQSTNWRDYWGDVETNYQVKTWNGSMLFGPKNFNQFRSDMSKNPNYGIDDDYDHMCMMHRHEYEYEWRLQSDHPIRLFVESIFPNKEDINVVNYYVSPPGGYLFPHRDNTSGKKQLNKIYIPLQWAKGNELGFYNWGNAPFKEGEAYLVNNYSHTHWFVNRSDLDRIVLAIGSNLQSIENLIIESFLKV